jgi:hypothetical protein
MLDQWTDVKIAALPHQLWPRIEALPNYTNSVAELACLARNLYSFKQKFLLLCTTINFEHCTTSVDISMSVNIQCQQILLGIEELEKYLQEKLVREALDLDSNAETSRYKELLLRLKRSLAQYTEQDKRLVYVGFMGHFSTGKSSTINLHSAGR